MKPYIACAIVLLLAGTLVSCGGGGDGADNASNGGSPGHSIGPNPGDNGGGGSDSRNDNDGSIGPLPSAGALVEESDTAVTLSDGWTQSSSRYGWSGGAARQSTLAGATAKFRFTGRSVTWIGSRGTHLGIASVKLDDRPPFEVNLYAKPFEVRTRVLTLNDLSDGPHTLTIEVTGRADPRASSNTVVIDAFEVEPQIVSRLQDTDPDAVYSAGWDHLDDGRWSGGGVATGSDPAFGGARATETAGANVTLKNFRGTSISWIGYRGPDAGIAVVRIDGGDPREVDLYSPSEKIQEVVFTAKGLTDATHTLTIEATGRKNDASTGARVVVDAFDVSTPGRRYEQYAVCPPQFGSTACITYSGTWNDDNVNRVWSEGMAATTSTVGARATFSFTGTSVSWIGCEKSSIGSARIYIDGAPVKIVNMNKPVGIEGYQRTIFRVDGLTNGPHTLTVEAFAGLTVVDAFDVHP